MSLLPVWGKRSKRERHGMYMKVTVVIPNYNGMNFIEPCMEALLCQTYKPFHILMVDNGSTDGSLELVQNKYPQVRVMALGENTGFCKAVNVGIQASDTPYVLLLNNDTRAEPEFVERLVEAMEQGGPGIFSVSALMLMMHDPQKADDAGDCYCALGWAFARGKGKPAEKFNRPGPIFAACGGAALYRRSVFEEIGYFDEEHFAYLEDIDIGYRARIYGYGNLFEPRARVLHAGSGTTGSKYNSFKANLSSANNVYMIGKNMPFLQWLLNFPLLLIGFFIKWLFFLYRKMGTIYIRGCLRGLKRCFSSAGRQHKVPFRWRNTGNYVKIQIQLWMNIFRRFYV